MVVAHPYLTLIFPVHQQFVSRKVALIKVPTFFKRNRVADGEFSSLEAHLKNANITVAYGH